MAYCSGVPHRTDAERDELSPARALERWGIVARGCGHEPIVFWLTDAEAEAFSAELKGLTERYEAGRSSVDHPAGTRRVACLIGIVPVAEGHVGP